MVTLIQENLEEIGFVSSLRGKGFGIEKMIADLRMKCYD